MSQIARLLLPLLHCSVLDLTGRATTTLSTCVRLTRRFSDEKLISLVPLLLAHAVVVSIRINLQIYIHNFKNNGNTQTHTHIYIADPDALYIHAPQW